MTSHERLLPIPMTKHERIIAAIEHAGRNGVKKTEIARFCGVSRTAVSQWSKGDVKELKYDNLRNLAKICGVSVDWLADGKGEMLSREIEDVPGSYQFDSGLAPAPVMAGMAPEISWVQAGAWTEVCHVELDPESVNWYPRPPGASERSFVLRVVGESMAPEYTPGRLIFVDPERAADSGDDVIAVMTETGEATFKRFIEEPGSGRMLKALNPAWQEPYVRINGNCRIVGVVVADMRIR